MFDGVLLAQLAWYMPSRLSSTDYSAGLGRRDLGRVSDWACSCHTLCTSESVFIEEREEDRINCFSCQAEAVESNCSCRISFDPGTRMRKGDREKKRK